MASRLNIPLTSIEMWQPDYGFVSYGNMPFNQLKTLVDCHLDYLNDIGVDRVLIGCFTISCLLADYIRSKVDIPVIDVYSGIPKLPNNTVVLCTKRSAEVFKHQYQNTVVCKELASIIERGFDNKTIKAFLRGYLVGVPKGRPVLVACTHYYYCLDLIKEVMRPEIVYTPEMFIK